MNNLTDNTFLCAFENGLRKGLEYFPLIISLSFLHTYLELKSNIQFQNTLLVLCLSIYVCIHLSEIGKSKALPFSQERSIVCRVESKFRCLLPSHPNHILSTMYVCHTCSMVPHLSEFFSLALKHLMRILLLHIPH